jgi:hypothetical protein
VKRFPFLIVLIITSCTHKFFKGSPAEGKNTFAYVDEGGTYRLVREFKKINNQLVSRSQIIDVKGAGSKTLEKSVIVSQIGSTKHKNSRLLTIRPLASEFEVWLEGKKYSSKMNINTKTKSMRMTLESPDEKWQGTSEIKFPKGKYFCFFNQIPECLYHNYLLTLAHEQTPRKFDFYVLWDSYPYIQDQLTRVGKSLFAPASVKFDGVIKNHFRYIVEIEGQMIFYEFTKSYDLVKMAWIAQGITVAPPGEEIVEDE